MLKWKHLISVSLIATTALISGHTDPGSFEDLFTRRLTPVEFSHYRPWSEILELNSSMPVARMRAMSGCIKGVNPRARDLFFEVFSNLVVEYPKMNVELAVARFSKILAMSMKESSGVSAMATDMKLRGSRLSLQSFVQDNRGREWGEKYRSTLDTYHKLIDSKSITFNHQTNFGLLQMSADRMYPNFLGDIIQRMAPELKALAARDPQQLYQQCGAVYMYHDEPDAVIAEYATLASCDVDYRTTDGVKCFGRWMMLCPNMNISLALATTNRYFQTRKAVPKCADSFRVLAKAIKRRS